MLQMTLKALMHVLRNASEDFQNQLQKLVGWLRLMMKKSKSILDTVHKSVQGLHDAGLVDAITMRKFDELCIEPAEAIDSKEIKKIRLSQNVSQAVFAKYLNISPSTVQKWETGEKKPSGIALRFLHVVAKSGLEIIPSGKKQDRA